jgi:hypothetical protein
MKGLIVGFLFLTSFSIMAATTTDQLKVVKAGCDKTGYVYYVQNMPESYVSATGDDLGANANVARCYFRGSDLVIRGVESSALIEEMCNQGYHMDKQKACKTAAYKQLRSL